MATPAEIRQAGLDAWLEAASEMEGDPETGLLTDEEWAQLEQIRLAAEEMAAEAGEEAA